MITTIRSAFNPVICSTSPWVMTTFFTATGTNGALA
jgi:hypothetical protein